MNLSYISPKAAVRESPIQGRGLFAVEAIGRDEIVAIKGGHVFDRGTLVEVERTLGAAEIQIGEDLFIGPLAPSEREGSMIYSNHSCEPNIGVRGQIIFLAMRDIAAGEELTHDWATTDDDTYRMECRCGAPACRKIITGQDWRRIELQEKYGHYMSWYLLEKIAKAGG
ncbi:MAG TPA: SET domain-containing protein-lysine N-methyltransferase [Pyrinomonadaceae bacterium]|nr:SET domain-containing protein-lysine N-methyltransferase [Pyrinomonadaceae bacterium]